MTPGLRERWSQSFTDPSGGAFASIVVPDVELDGSIFARPVHGRLAVWTILHTAAGIYDRLTFTREATGDGRVYLEWTGTAVGMPVDGVTILVLGDQGHFTKVALHHRPLAAVLAFSAEMANRLSAGSGADHFYQVP
jgi:hypothetical protein